MFKKLLPSKTIIDNSTNVKNIKNSTITISLGESQEEIIPPNLYHLSEPTTALIGRQAELKQLTERFTDGKTRLAIIVAAGGIGKSALTYEWLREIGKPEHNYHGKTRIFGWSFYSQGSHNTFTNSQPFFSAVLPFLGITEIPKDEIEKARLLARECQKQPCLLILDGLEPLQYAENLPSMNGELQDSALKEFILQFRRAAGQSFVLLSSRQPLVELKKWQAEHFLNLPLATLPHSDGATLLAKLGVQGNDTERQAISQDLNGHALSLVLMGHLLREYHEGDPRYANELNRFPLYQRGTEGDFINTDAEKDSRHALRVLDYYDSLQDAVSRCFLQLLGLFDRPMQPDEKRELIAKAELAAPLRALSDAEWKKLEQRLENNGLLLGKKGSFGRLEWDTHPIIRSYFGEKFKENYPEEFKQAHSVLFDYYQKLPEKEFPDTLEEMLPLYRAVVHGCLAGEYQQAISENYFRRINREYYYSQNYLGAYSNDLSILKIAISEIQKEEILNIPESALTNILAVISSCLMSLGRLRDSIKYTKEIIKRYSNFNDDTTLHCIAISYQNLVDMYFALGKLNLAEEAARRSIEYSKSSKNYDCEIIGCNYLATTYYFYGKLKESEIMFKEAIANSFSTQRQDISEYTQIISDRFFCLQIERSKNKSEREKILVNRLNNACQKKYDDGLYPKANECLTLALCCVASENKDAELFFNRAIAEVQKSNAIIFNSEFYLSHADFYLTQNQLEKAAADLNSAYEIIERCDMKLYQVDYCLIYGRYSLAIQDVDTAINHYEEAQILIQETSYHLRDAELDLLAARICRSTKQVLYSKNANDYLQKAKKRIEEIGQWGLWRVIERDFPDFAASHRPTF
ncbi:hypothetical protein JCM14076_15800 [Methylosoma difficile]